MFAMWVRLVCVVFVSVSALSACKVKWTDDSGSKRVAPWIPDEPSKPDEPKPWTPAEQEPKVNPVLKTASCAFGYSEGPEEFQIFPNESLTQAPFAKIYDANRLSPLMPLSMEGVQNFIKTSGQNLSDRSVVNLYQVHTETSYCKPLVDYLAPPPADQQGFWDQITTTTTGQKGTLLGLYLPIQYRGIQSVNVHPAILVADFASKWTLVHEFMHHLFHSQLKKDIDTGKAWSDEAIIDLLNDEKKGNALVKKFRDSTTKQDRENAALELATYFELYSNMAMHFLRRYALEEMTIEKLLIEKFQKSEFVLTHKIEVVSGAAYIVSSYKGFSEFKGTLEKMGSQIREEIGNESEPALAKIRAANEYANRIDAEAKPIHDWAHDIVLQYKHSSSSYHGIIAPDESLEIIEKTCSHGEMPISVETIENHFGM